VVSPKKEKEKTCPLIDRPGACHYLRALIKQNHFKGDSMSRPTTLFTGQWADLPLEEIAQKASEWDYDGLELACWGDHFEVTRAIEEEDYCQKNLDILEKYDLQCWAISNHLAGQAVCDAFIDSRHQAILPAAVWGDGKPEGVRKRASDEMKKTARAARRLAQAAGHDIVVNGFTGSPIWHMVYSFPPTAPDMIEAGFREFAERWNPILDVFREESIKFGLEVHPGEIAFDLVTAQKALDALDQREEFGFNFDPSHLHWQGVNPVEFIRAFPSRIFHVHVKDAIITLDGRSGILASHLPFGDARRGWDFRSPGRGGVNFEEIVRALNLAGYAGPLSVEWEDSGMAREHGAAESARFVKELDFEPSQRHFDASFSDHS
jgi:sugar phosphate isomerase/epimerase